MPGSWKIVCIAGALLVTCANAAAPNLTTIEDVLYRADGTRFDGSLEVDSKSFRAADGTEVVQQNLSVRVTAGNLLLRLAPTTNAAKPVFYTVRYISRGKAQTEYWAVPPSSVPVRLTDVRTHVGAISQQPPQGTFRVQDIQGLQAELASRPVRSANWATVRVAMWGSDGKLTAVEGSSTDCIHADGSTGPCGNAPGGTGSSGGVVWVDAETPSGVINGSNVDFDLSTSPAPANSLMLYRNGVLLKPGLDFILTGQHIAFDPAAVPLNGDIVQAWFRVESSGSALQAVNGAIPAGTCNGVNRTFTSTLR